ncbi:hypothetical protein [Sphingomonas sp.]|uniref:hypothetical protein n=1 Tax=Sphingomonas sp. TaxID=28214 RepID=UPI00307E57A5
MKTASLTSQPRGGSDRDLPGSEAEMRQRIHEAAEGVVSRLQTLADEQVRKKKPIEERWLEDLRAYNGLYDPETETLFRSNPERSRAFVNMPRTKTNAWRARLADLLFPADDRNWGINPTPVPELENSAKRAVEEAERLHAEAEAAAEEANRAAAMQDPQGQVAALNDGASKGALAIAMIQHEAEARRTMEEAKRRSEGMAREIDDQLTESKYPARCRDVIDDGCKLGVGVLKGPLTANRPRRSWKRAEGNVYELTSSPDPRPEYRRVDPWSFFPDMNASTPDEWEFTFERHLPTKKELRKLTRTLDFDKDAVRDLLKNEGPDRFGSNDNMHYLSQLRALQGEEAISGRYVLWEYHGPLEVEDITHLLRSLGRDEEAVEFEEQHDPLDEHLVVIYFCNGRVLKMSTDYVLDSGESLYSVFQFEKGEGSVMSAIGVPRMAMNSFRALNGAWRMTLDNAALSVGPQIAIDKTQVEPEDGSWRLTPRKVWIKKGSDANANAKAFDIFNIPANQAQLAGIIELALKFIDEETSLPLIAQGEQGQHITQTLGGMSMLFNSANVVFRRVVKNWDDDLTTPVIRRSYDWNMQFSAKDEIKGDMQIEARGTSVLLVREIMSQQLIMIAQTWSQHPVMGVALKLYDAMRMAVQSLSINPDDILEPKDEFEKRLKKMQEDQAGQQSPDIIRAQAAIEAAKIQAESRAADGQVQLQIAELRRETELIGLASKGEIELEKLRAMLGMKKLETDSAERKLAAEIGVEQQMAAEARARGEEPTGSGGAVSAGTVQA